MAVFRAPKPYHSRNATPPQTVTLTQKSNPFTEFERLRKGTGLKLDDFARAMGVSVAMVQEWESKREKPTSTELKLMSLIQASPTLSKQMIE
jgi:putative transcriptional regulator